MRVPEKVGNGKAKVTLSFPDWKEGKVIPASLELPVLEPEPNAQAKEEQPLKAAARARGGVPRAQRDEFP